MVVAQTERIRHLPVVDNDDELVGLVTQTDLANAHFRVVEVQSDLIKKSIASETADLKKANEELQALSMVDHLTEIGNRRAMEVDLQHTHAASVRYDRSYAVMLLDIDYFKKYNDYYGHTAGDDTLRRAADFLKHAARTSDRLYRYGGEEFLLLMPETGAKQALATAKRLTLGLAREKIPHIQSPYGVVSVSAGVAGADDFEGADTCWEDLVQWADRGLYKAKDAGRNQAQEGG